MFVGTTISYLFLIGQDRSLGAAFTIVSSGLLCCLVVMFLWLFGDKEANKTRKIE